LALKRLIAALALGALASAAHAQERLAPLATLEGCWLGSFSGPNQLQDERCFTPIAGGQQWRDVHEVVGVGYGGETIYAWDAAAQRIDVSYYANDGGLMRGYAVVSPEGIAFPEARYVGANGGVQQLRSRWTLGGDGFEVVTERLEDGAWRELMRISYRRK
jgi:hypothetical protein